LGDLTGAFVALPSGPGHAVDRPSDVAKPASNQR
jgi:hypothetical protein